MINALVTFKNIVEEFRLKSKIPEIEWANLKMLAIRAYQDLCRVSSLPQARVVVKSTMDANYIIDLPSDLEELNAVYVPDNNGKFFPLSKDNRIVSTVTGTPPSISRDEDAGEGVDIYDPGGYYFSATGGVNIAGYYTVDWQPANRRILFTNVETSDVILDYLSSGVSDTETAYIPGQAIGAIHAYMAYYYNLYRNDVPANKLMVYKDELRIEKQKLRNMRFNIVDFEDWILRTLSAAPLR
jgi:hypothetical protein